MRFGADNSRSPRPAGNPLHWRVGLLLVMLVAVLLLMRQFQQPATVDKLGRLFSLEAGEGSGERTLEGRLDGRIDDAADESSPVRAAGEPVALAERPPSVRLDDVPTATGQLPPGAPESPSIDPELLRKVKDNTFFRASENDAWLAVLRAAAASSVGQLASQSLGPTAYAPLIKQPHVYRGKVITVRGRVVREEPFDAPENKDGIERYHRLIVAPEGGGQWPYVVYALNLPSSFPRGDKLREQVVIHGFFFKSWSYPSNEGGLELAPLVVAPGIDWTPGATRAPRRSTWPVGALVAGVLAALACAAVVAWWVSQQTKRPRAGRGEDNAAAANLEKLAPLEGET